jgi:transposase-like protein
MATMQEKASTSIVKADRTGRTRYTDQYKAEVVAAFAASGLSGPAFARQCGVKYPTFASWVTKARRQDDRQESDQAARPFIIAEIGEGSASGAEVLEVRLPGGSTALAGTSEQVVLLAELLKALA